MLRQGTTFTLPQASSEIFAGGQGKAAKHHSKISIEEAKASVNRATGMRIHTRKRDHPRRPPRPQFCWWLAAAFGIHNFWTAQDPQAKMNEQIHFLIVLLGFVLMTLAIPRPWDFSLGR